MMTAVQPWCVKPASADIFFNINVVEMKCLLYFAKQDFISWYINAVKQEVNLTSPCTEQTFYTL